MNSAQYYDLITELKLVNTRLAAIQKLLTPGMMLSDLNPALLKDMRPGKMIEVTHRGAVEYIQTTLPQEPEWVQQELPLTYPPEARDEDIHSR